MPVHLHFGIKELFILGRLPGLAIIGSLVGGGLNMCAIFAGVSFSVYRRVHLQLAFGVRLVELAEPNLYAEMPIFQLSIIFGVYARLETLCSHTTLSLIHI